MAHHTHRTHLCTLGEEASNVLPSGVLPFMCDPEPKYIHALNPTMSSEVCPFCGKTYKRLKSHLPHCKAAASSKTPLTQRDIAANPTGLSPQPAAGLLEKKSTQTKKTKKVSGLSQSISTAPSSKSENASSTSQTAASSLLTSTSVPSTAKKKKQKLSDQIKITTTFPADISSPSLSPSPSPVPSKPKKQSLRALIEAAKSIQVSEGSGSSSQSGSLNSGAKTIPNKHTDAKPKRADKLKKSGDAAKGDFWEENRREREALSANEMLWKSESSSHQARITLQDAKTMLGRAKSSRKGILNQIDGSLGPVPVQAGNQNVDLSCFVTTKPLLSNQQPGLQHELLTPAVRRKCKQASLIPQPQHDGSCQAATPLPSEHLSSQVSQAPPLPPTAGLNEGLKAGRHMMSLTQFSGVSHHFPPAAPTVPVRVETGEKLQLRRGNAAGDGTKGALNQRILGQVRLRELPAWLACRTPTRPGDVVEIMDRGWQWYYRKYIDVKKGSVGGLAMLLTGYCVLSYIWSYPRIKRDRWRKYH